MSLQDLFYKCFTCFCILVCLEHYTRPTRSSWKPWGSSHGYARQWGTAWEHQKNRRHTIRTASGHMHSMRSFQQLNLQGQRPTELRVVSLNRYVRCESGLYSQMLKSCPNNIQRIHICHRSPPKYANHVQLMHKWNSCNMHIQIYTMLLDAFNIFV